MDEVKKDALSSFGECIVQLKRGQVHSGLLASLRYHCSRDARSLVRAVCVGSDWESLRVLLEDYACGPECASALHLGLSDWDKETRLAVVNVVGCLVDKVLNLAEAAQAASVKQKRVLDEDGLPSAEVPQSVRLLCERLWPNVSLVLIAQLGDGSVLDFAVSDCLLSISVLASYCEAVGVSTTVSRVLERLEAWYARIRGADLIVIAVAQLKRNGWCGRRPDAWSRCVGFLARKNSQIEKAAKSLVKEQLQWLASRKALASIEQGLILLCLLLGRLGPKRRRKALLTTGFRSVVLEHLSVAPDCAVALVVEAAEPAVREIVLENLLEPELLLHSPDEETVWRDVFCRHANAVERIGHRNAAVLAWFLAISSSDKFSVLLDLLKSHSASQQMALSSKREFWKACLKESLETWTSKIVGMSALNWELCSNILFEEMVSRPEDARLVSITSNAASRLSVSVLAPLLVKRMREQPELTLDLLDDANSGIVVKQMLFDRLAPLLLIRVLPSSSLEAYSDLLAPLLLRRMRVLCEFDQCRRLAAEAMASKVRVDIALTCTMAEFDQVTSTLKAGEEERNVAVKAIVHCWCCLAVAGRLADHEAVKSLFLRSLDVGDELGFVLLKSPTLQSAALKAYLVRPADMTSLLIRFFLKFKSEVSAQAIGVIDFVIKLDNPTRERWVAYFLRVAFYFTLSKSASVLLHACAVCKEVDIARGRRIAAIAFAMTDSSKSVEENIKGIALFSALLASPDCVGDLELVSGVMKVLARFSEPKQPEMLRDAANRILSLLQMKD